MKTCFSFSGKPSHSPPPPRPPPPPRSAAGHLRPKAPRAPHLPTGGALRIGSAVVETRLNNVVFCSTVCVNCVLRCLGGRASFYATRCQANLVDSVQFFLHAAAQRNQGRLLNLRSLWGDRPGMLLTELVYRADEPDFAQQHLGGKEREGVAYFPK